MKDLYSNSERNTTALVKPLHQLRLLLIVLAVCLFGNVVNAATITSAGGGGLWSSPATWVGGVVPSASDIVIINGSVTVDINNAVCASITVNGGNLTINSSMSLTVGTSTASGNLTFNSAGILTMSPSPAGSPSTLIIYGNYVNSNGADAIFNNNDVVILGDFTTSKKANFNGGNLVVGGNIGGPFDTQSPPTPTIYAVNPNAIVTINGTTNNVTPGVLPTSPPETAALISIVNTVIYGGNCPFTISNITNFSFCPGSTAVFTVSTNASGPTYQWQFSTDGTTWTDVVNSALYSGVNTSSLTISNVTSGMNNYKYRAKITSGGCTKNGNYGLLLKSPNATTITSQSTAAQTLCDPGTFSPISVTATGLALTYQWYSNTSASNSGGTLLSGATTNTYTPSGATVGTLYYYCTVTGTCGGTVTSTISGAFNVRIPIILTSTTASNVNVCAGSSSAVTLTSDVTMLPVGAYTVNYEIQGVAQTPSIMIVTTAGTGTFVDSGFTSVGVRKITITSITSGNCTSIIDTNGIFDVTVLSTLTAPTLLAGSGATCSQITANWQATAGATYYELDVSTQTGPNFDANILVGLGYNALNVGLVTTFDVAGLLSNTNYYYRVRAFNGTCISLNATTPMQYATASTPGVPGTPITVSKGCDELKISWTAGTRATSYEVQWATNNNTPFTPIGSQSGITTLNYTITGLTTIKYYFRVRSVNGCSAGAFTPTASATLNTTPPTLPASINTPTAVFCDNFTIAWPVVSSAISYTVEWATTNTPFTTIGSQSGILASTYTITGLNPSTSYFYRVWTENGCGLSSSATTGASSQQTLAGAPSAPTNVQTPTILCTQFTMSWTASTGAKSYTVERALDSGFTTGLVTVNNVAASPYIFTGLTPGTQYFYRVRAVSCSPSPYTTGTPSSVTTSSILVATPTITPIGAALTFCETSSVQLSTSVVANASYQWYLNGSPIIGEISDKLFVFLPGSYTVEITDKSSKCSALSSATNVIVQGLPTATAGGSQTICSTDTATVSGATATNGSISWTHNGFGSLTNATTATPIYTPAAGDIGNTVTLTMTVTSNNTCSPQIETATYTVMVTSGPAAPSIGTITQRTNCASTGSVVLNGLPATGTWDLYQNGSLLPLITGGSGTNTTITGLSSGTYTYTVSTGACTSLVSASAVINPLVLITNIWNGAVWSTGSAPSSDAEDIVFDANYSINADLTGCTCLVKAGKNVIIQPGKTLKVTKDLTVDETTLPIGTLTFNDTASLVQIDDNAVNTGNITYKRSSTSAREEDYTYWSSPVAGQKLLDVSPQTPTSYFYSFDPTTYSWSQVITPATTFMDFGEGYIIRNRPIPPGPPPGFYVAPFIGVPNNGMKTIPNIIADAAYLLGNPYPSALDADKFLQANVNVLSGTLYFWTHNTAMQDRNLISPLTAGSGALAYTSDDYATYNATGGVGAYDPTTTTGSAPSDPNHSVSGVDNGVIPTGKIGAAQGFFASSLVSIAPGSSILFNNSMRVDNSGNPLNNSQFFKTKNPKDKSAIVVEKNRIWLDLKNTQGAFKQTLVGYVTDATNDYDSRFDGESYDGNEFVDFYSINQDKNLVIQGRALPFDENDTVPLGFRSTIDGEFTINIDQTDGLLTNQPVFIEDKLTHTTFDLKSGNYTFNTIAGTFNDRFVLRYIDKTLGTKKFDTLENTVLVSNKNKQIKINSFAETIDKVTVYDLLGRQLYQKTKVDSNELVVLNLVSNHQTLIVKTALQNGKTVTKKIIF